MSKKLTHKYIVLRQGQCDSFETIGPSAPSYDNFENADKEAKVLRDRYPQLTFVVTQAVRVYSHQHRAHSITLVEAPKKVLKNHNPVVHLITHEKKTMP